MMWDDKESSEGSIQSGCEKCRSLISEILHPSLETVI